LDFKEYLETLEETFLFTLTPFSGRRKKSHPVKQLLNTCVFAEKLSIKEKSSCLEPSIYIFFFFEFHRKSIIIFDDGGLLKKPNV
jgi:hypothetical protein